MQQDHYNQLISQLERQTKVTELDFTSAVPVVGPLIAAFRRGWSNIATRWVMRHYAAQQLEFQRTLIGLLRDMQQQLSEANTRLIRLEQNNAGTATLHETFNRDIEMLTGMLAKHGLHQTAHPKQE